MMEFESHLLAWMRMLDGKLDGLKTDLAEVKADLAAVKDKLGGLEPIFWF